MPEGPSIVILKDAVMQFKGREVTEAGGNSKALDASSLPEHPGFQKLGQTLFDLFSKTHYPHSFYAVWLLSY